MLKSNHKPADLPLIAAIQLTASDSVESNLDIALTLLQEAKKQGAICAVLPEMFAWIGHEKDALSISENPGTGQIQQFLSDAATNLGLYLIGGSLRLMVANDPKKRVTNTCLVFNPSGEQMRRYDKIHMFDADVSDGEAYIESDTIQAGRHLGMVEMPFARIGLSICYDLRFPALYQSLRKLGADIIVVPSAFTVPTGRAHWKTLLRARAIENQVYIIAPAQCGTHSNGRQTWGHSICIDPWGEVVSELEHTPGVIYCPFDAKALEKIRCRMPVLEHRRSTYEPTSAQQAHIPTIRGKINEIVD